MNKPFKNALVMAAGRGDRMRPLTDVVPKAMSPYRGSTLITHCLTTLVANVERIHVTVGYKNTQLASHILPLGVSSLFNTDGKPNGWWISHTLMRLIDEPVVVGTCDVVAKLDFAALRRDYEKLGSPACLLVPVKPSGGVEGDYIHRQGDVVTRLDRRVSSEMYCSGIQVINPFRTSLLTGGAEDFYQIWERLMAERQVKVSSVMPDEWHCFDTLEQLMKAA